VRILNPDSLTAHGNRQGRGHLVQILEAGLCAADPYANTLRLIRLEGQRIIVGHPLFEPSGTPNGGDAVFHLSDTGRILVLGAGKGVHRVAEAIETALGDRLSGGHVIVKHGDQPRLQRVGYTHGAHPLPDDGCLEGCRRILELCQGLRSGDLVFTIAANGVSSLLTLPVDGVSLEDVRRTVYAMQIERGAPTRDLNPVRNHLDLLKGGRISRYLQPATAIHIVVRDPDGPLDEPDGYDKLMHHNLWLHTLPDCTTFQDAVDMLNKWHAWEAVPASVRAHLQRADPRHETVGAAEFQQWHFRVFGVMPRELGMLPAAQAKARELGYEPVTLSTWLEGEASQAATVIAGIAATIERDGVPFAPPCALFTTGELLVTVGDREGVGGRNQEYAIAAALDVAGSRNIVMGAVDSDGTDGPGCQFSDGRGQMPALAGGIVDGFTLQEAEAAGLDLFDELRRHNTGPALWKLDSAVVASQNVSMLDLGVTLIMGRR